MKHSTDYSSAIFHTDTDRATGRTIIVESTLGDFLMDYCEDPARALVVVEDDEYEVEPATEEEEEYTYADGTVEPAVPAKDAVIETRWHVQMNPYAQINARKTYSTHETEEEAREAVLDGLYWDWWNGRCGDTPANADTREELEANLRENGVEFVTEHRLDQLRRATANRVARRKAEKEARLAALAGDDAAVLREWWASETYHPAPNAVMEVKERLNLTWKEVRVIAKSQPSTHA